MTEGAKDIVEERLRQIREEGWADAHDDQHTRGELVAAGICYAAVAQAQALDHEAWPAGMVPVTWPWAAEWWKPSDDPLRNLARAGALIAAEIDRLYRATA